MSLIEDEPVDNAELLGLGKFAETIFTFLTSENLISPLAIAINGEWGSGKTSLIKTLQKTLESTKSTYTAIFFDAWKYEFSDPAAALFYVIAKALGLDKRELLTDAKSILSISLDIFARKYAGISMKDLKDHFENGISSTELLNDKLETMISKSGVGRAIVLIDDLDRCSLQNVLEVLDSLKLFLAIKNFVFVIALDMDKVKLAWSQKYRAHAEEFSYMEKIFQADINVPQPTAKQIIDYVHFLNPQIPLPFIELISIIRIRNPRKIKRLLNGISIRAAAAKKYPLCHEVAFLWTIAEQLMGIKELLNLYDQLGGANEFYNWLTYAGRLQWGSGDTTDQKKAKGLIELNGRNSSKYLSPLVGKSRHELSLFMIKSSNALQPFKNEDRNQIINAINEVVSFSIGG